MSFGQALAALFMSLTLLLLGLSCLLWPKTMQEYALKHSTRRWLKNSSSDWMKTPQYLRYLRLMGGGVFVVGVLATIILAKKWFGSWFI